MTCSRCSGLMGIGSLADVCVLCLIKGLSRGDGGDRPRDEPIRIGPYALIEELGRGAMGVVHLARHVELDRFVALKSISPSSISDPSAERRFMREARAAARLRHPHIISVHEVARYNGSLYYAMDYAEGGDLASRLHRRGSGFSPVEAAQLISKVARAIHHAHEKGVVHRDLKPSNILINSTGEPVVGDFGLACIPGAEVGTITATDAIIGTPAYLSPECVTGRLSPRYASLSDVYALGAILFELIAGRPPFEAQHIAELLHAIAERPAPRLNLTVAGVPAVLSDLCAACLEKDPLRRPASAAVLALGLESIEIGTTPGSWLERIKRSSSSALVQRRIRRSTFIIAGGGVVAFGLMIFRPTFVGAPTTIQAPNSTSKLKPAETISHFDSLAVLPFDVIAGNEATREFAEGLQEDLLTHLSKISDLRVASSRSVRALGAVQHSAAELGKLLGVSAIVEGSIRLQDGHFRVQVQVTNVRTGLEISREEYNREATQSFSLQSDISLDIAQTLLAQIKPSLEDDFRRIPSLNPEALQLYDRSRSLLRSADQGDLGVKTAEPILTKAVTMDPNFADAWVQLSRLHTLIYAWGHDRDDRRLESAYQCAEKALKLVPNLPAANMALGDYFFRGRKDFRLAKRFYEKALAVLPGNTECLAGIANIERREGHWEEAIVRYQKAISLNTPDPLLYYNSADTYMRMKAFSDANSLVNEGLAHFSHHPLLTQLKGDIFVAWKGDVGPMREDILTRRPDVRGVLFAQKVELAILERKFEEGLRFLEDNISFEKVEGQAVITTRESLQAELHYLAGRPEQAREAARAAVEKLLPLQLLSPRDARVAMVVGQMHAILGQDAPARENLECPFIADKCAADAFDRGIYRKNRIVAFARLGDFNRALEELKIAVKEPGSVTAAYVRLSPRFDLLRGADLDKILGE